MMKETLKLEIQDLIKKLDLNCEVKEFKDKVDWFNISLYQKLSENFICEFKDKVNWFYISKYQKLSENFICELQYKVDWHNISLYQTLSEGFIRKFQHKVNWHNISIYQKLSEGFIREFQHEVYWANIPTYQILTDDFRKEFNLVLSKNITRNWTLEQRANMVLESDFKFYIDDIEITKENLKDYINKLEDAYILGYKTIRKDRYSHFNFHFRYKEGEIYETNCDYNLRNENSFGFGVFSSKEKCTEFNSELNFMGIIIEIKVQLKDLAVIVENGQKIRASKMEILS